METPGVVVDEQVLDLLANPPAGRLWQQSDRELCDWTEDLTALRRAVLVAEWRQLDEMAAREGSKRAVDAVANWLHAHSELLLSDARMKVKLAVRMCANPTVLAAFADGDIGEREAKYVVDFIAYPPKDMYTKLREDGTDAADADDAGVPMDEDERETVRGEIRKFLLFAAGTRNMDTLRAEGEKLRDVLSKERNPGEDIDRNTLEIAKLSHGRVDLKGNFDTETGENLLSALEPFMVPRPEFDHSPDRRSRSQICADALSELLRRSQPGTDGKGGAPIRPRISVHIPIDVLFADIPTHAQRCQMVKDGQIREALRAATRGWMGRMGSISLAGAQRLACDCELTMIGADIYGAPLTVNTSQRFASDKHRIALEGRDHGCAFPGCDRPADWTQAHHIVPWEIRQETQIDGLCLLCTAHHVAVHHQGWDVLMGRNRFPVFRPPVQIDSLRRWLDSNGNYAEDPPGQGSGLEPLFADTA